ncbi:hypothetical protein JTE90_001760 [Oedothorax gibbosus]|uniref:Uncharacterized protein n=1 Tax=Oedothorax gibbosus TaxID=931172 RepID=A0AAV6VQN1_9ARAC|nr:hypothetical protein JTE90_001760 [Oedothorax gibbosus]
MLNVKMNKELSHLPDSRASEDGEDESLTLTVDEGREGLFIASEGHGQERPVSPRTQIQPRIISRHLSF